MSLELQIELANPPGINILEVQGIQGPAGPSSTSILIPPGTLLGNNTDDTRAPIALTPGEVAEITEAYQDTFQVTVQQNSLNTTRPINILLSVFIDGQKMHTLNDYIFDKITNSSLIVFGQPLIPGNFVEINYY